ncbi:MAG: hypothetical protein KA063_05020 [Firmicutes bacterium]|nr:hypothetical protein [Bacillota bacterium]
MAIALAPALVLCNADASVQLQGATVTNTVIQTGAKVLNPNTPMQIPGVPSECPAIDSTSRRM